MDTTTFCLCAKIQLMSQDDVPVASYSAPSRRLQCTQSQATVFYISRRRKSSRSEALQPCAKNPVDKESNHELQWTQSQATVLCISNRQENQTQRIQTQCLKNQLVAKQLTNYEELRKLDVNC
ncbi:hypothetical protein F511_30649 [Dorcoceras hygrometricum]|uniref:Uncharacterized protein n=1 Tax=Dorcoceras hygrometricum TaxID=472368 RepID=A0A2Z7AFY1_9LAMI|nr:hypothetical protein F511_30649 [Dorcoceras hygrometricum]